jgi:hypothetical protein
MKKINTYILDKQGKPKLEPDILKWGRWFGSGSGKDRVLAQDRISMGGLPEVTVSTVFLGVDHDWGYDLPILWETMIFGGSHDQYQERYSSKEAALAGHKRAVDMVKREQATVTSFQESLNVHRG